MPGVEQRPFEPFRRQSTVWRRHSRNPHTFRWWICAVWLCIVSVYRWKYLLLPRILHTMRKMVLESRINGTGHIQPTRQKSVCAHTALMKRQWIRDEERIREKKMCNLKPHAGERILEHTKHSHFYITVGTWRRNWVEDFFSFSTATHVKSAPIHWEEKHMFSPTTEDSLHRQWTRADRSKSLMACRKISNIHVSIHKTFSTACWLLEWLFNTFSFIKCNFVFKMNPDNVTVVDEICH